MAVREIVCPHLTPVPLGQPVIGSGRPYYRAIELGDARLAVCFECWMAMRSAVIDSLVETFAEAAASVVAGKMRWRGTA